MSKMHKKSSDTTLEEVEPLVWPAPIFFQWPTNTFLRSRGKGKISCVESHLNLENGDFFYPITNSITNQHTHLITFQAINIMPGMLIIIMIIMPGMFMASAVTRGTPCTICTMAGMSSWSPLASKSRWLWWWITIDEVMMILWKPLGKIITLTFAPTPRHGKNWREMMDERCEEDNAEYDRWLLFDDRWWSA